WLTKVKYCTNFINPLIGLVISYEKLHSSNLITQSPTAALDPQAALASVPWEIFDFTASLPKSTSSALQALRQRWLHQTTGISP
ncbi:hypothetical protein IWQ62_005662, partial [Dispira parvispora]